MPNNPDGYVEKYRPILSKAGALPPTFWAGVAEKEGMGTTDQKFGSELSSFYFASILGGLNSGNTCHLIWMSRSMAGNAWAHAYAVYGIDGYNLLFMDPSTGTYQHGDIRSLAATDAFLISY
jgi:hypothetical protein